MKKFLLLGLIVSSFYACKSKDGTKEADKKDSAAIDSTLITDSSWGLIDRKTDYESLKKQFGASNVKDERICGPECADSIDVTIVYPTTAKEIVVYWRDSAYHRTIEMVETGQPGSPYHTASGIKIGSTLGDIHKVYGGKLRFSGFGWDYGGYVSSYGDGPLDGSRLGIRLDFAQHPGSDSLYGDRELNTDMPIVKSNMSNIVITDLHLALNRF